MKERGGSRSLMVGDGRIILNDRRLLGSASLPRIGRSEEEGAGLGLFGICHLECKIERPDPIYRIQRLVGTYPNPERVGRFVPPFQPFITQISLVDQGYLSILAFATNTRVEQYHTLQFWMNFCI